MHVLSRRRLIDFWKEHPRAKEPLAQWFTRARKAEWRKFADVRADYNSADTVGKHVVFNIGGNKYRLITAIHYNRGKVYVLGVMTHSEYDKGGWKG